MNLEPVTKAKFEKYLCKIVEDCEKEENEKQFGHGGKPDKAWCDSPGKKPGKNNAREFGITKHECYDRKIMEVKAKSSTDFSKNVRTKYEGPVKGGGSCFPDVIVGDVWDCAAVYDFKSSCPLTPESKPSWSIYGYGKGKTIPPNKSWEGRTQGECYAETFEVEPEIIHPNSKVCGKYKK